MKLHRRTVSIFALCLLVVALGGCQSVRAPSPTPTATPTPTLRPSPTASSLPTLTPTAAVERQSTKEAREMEQPAISSPPPRFVTSVQAEAMRSETRDDLADLSNLTHYDIELSVDYEDLTFEGRQTVQYTNTERTPLDELNFRLFPNGERAYGDGFLLVSRVTVDDKSVDTKLSLEDTVLTVQLPATLNPGESVQLVLAFRGTVPEDFGGEDSNSGYGIYNFSDNVMALSGWYPILAVFDDEGWNLDPTSAVGDSVYSDAAFYTVDIATRDDLTVVATGIPVNQETLNGITHHRYVSGPARDFFITLSSNFRIVTDSVDDITVNSYYLPGHEAGGESALIIAMDALRTFNQRFGDYPYVELDVVDAPMRNAAGVEFPGVILIGDFLYDDQSNPFFETATAHEVAHQWWYNTVGSDVIDEPWLDEALVTYSSNVYFEEVEGSNAAQQILNSWGRAYDRVVEQGADDLITKPLAFWEQPEHRRYYGTIVYLKGALFFHAVREAIGDEAFFEALQDYYAANKYEIATPDELLNTFEEAAGRQLDDLYEEWLYSVESR